MRALLDVSVLLAVIDAEHQFHPKCRDWWSRNKAHGWASCPLTQNGFVRVISQSSYARPAPLLEAMRTLRASIAVALHEFWLDDLSILDSDLIDHSRLLSHRHITDVYLLALAVKHGGRFVTLDRGVPVSAVRGAGTEHCVVV